jgi:hypothetical protein
LPTRSPKTRKSAKRPVTAATLGVAGLERIAPIGDAMIVILAVVEEYVARYPKRAELARRDWARVVGRAFFDDHDGKAGRRPRATVRTVAPSAATLAKAIAAVDRIVRARLDEKGWLVAMRADEAMVTGLAWERIKLRCSRSDTESRKRLKKGRSASRKRVTGRSRR